MDVRTTVRPWFESDDWERAAESRGLSARERALVDRYRREGFVVVEDARVVDELDVDGIWVRNAERLRSADASGRMQDLWDVDPAVRGIATNEAVLDVLRLLYGREPIPFQTLNFYHGSEQRTHSDTIHFSSLPSGFMCGVWMALEDVTLRQGPLHYYPGSQRLPEFDYDDFGIPPVRGVPSWSNPETLAAYRAYEDKIASLARESGFVRAELAIPRGAFLIWSANLLHGGCQRDDRSLTRKSQVTHYYFENTVPFTPMFTRRREGRFSVRRVRDLRTGRWMVPSLDGRPVVFPDTGEWLRSIRPVHGVRALAGAAVAARIGLPLTMWETARVAKDAVTRRLRRR